MPYTDQERKANQLKMFGCTTEDLDAAVEHSILKDPLWIAMSILSDTQEILASDSDDDRARQYINRAKYLISNVVEANRRAERSKG